MRMIRRRASARMGMICRSATGARYFTCLLLGSAMGILAGLPDTAAFPQESGVLVARATNASCCESLTERHNDLYDRLYRGFVAGGNDADATVASLQSYLTALDRMRASGALQEYEFLYLNSVANSELFLALIDSDPDDAITRFDIAVEHATLAKNMNIGYAGIYSQYANVLNLHFVAKGAQSGLAYLQEILENIDRALALDEQDARAWYLRGSNLLFTPREFGGNPRKAISAFKEQIKHGNNYERLWGHIWLSVAYLESGNERQATKTIATARQEAPNNTLIANVEQAIEAGRNPF